jgi:hypothetical protein
MKGLVLVRAAAAVFALALAMPVVQAEDELEPVEMNARKALADCMLEAAASAIATIETTIGVCETGVWDIEVSVPEVSTRKLPIQGTLVVTNGVDTFAYNGKLTAKGAVSGVTRDVLCEVQTQDIENTFLGVEFTYASGQDNIYPDAQIDPDSPNLLITTLESRGTVTLADSPRDRLAEMDQLVFFELEDEIRADGFINVLLRRGNRIDVLSTWEIEPEDDLPLWIQATDGIEPGVFLEGFKAEFITDELDVDECEIDIEADIEVADFWLTVIGTLEMEAEMEELEAE